jgi:hypothetical protein
MTVVSETATLAGMGELTDDDRTWTDAYGAFDPQTLAYAVSRLLGGYMKREGATYDCAVHCIWACEAAKADISDLLRSGGDLAAFGRH